MWPAACTRGTDEPHIQCYMNWVEKKALTEPNGLVSGDRHLSNGAGQKSSKNISRVLCGCVRLRSHVPQSQEQTYMKKF